jgi:hypothetical protein
MNESTRKSLQSFGTMQAGVESLTRRIRYQDDTLKMLTSRPRHNSVLTALIKTSMSDNFRNTPYVGEADYLRFLTMAIEHSDPGST